MADGSPSQGDDERGAEDPEDDEGWYDDAGLFDSDDTFGPGTDDDPDATLSPDDM